MEKTVLELAQLIGGKVVGNESLVITETRGFEQAAPQSITFAIGERFSWLAFLFFAERRRQSDCYL